MIEGNKYHLAQIPPVSSWINEGTGTGKQIGLVKVKKLVSGTMEPESNSTDFYNEMPFSAGKIFFNFPG